MKLSPTQTKVITWSAIAAGLLLVSYLTYEIWFKKSPIDADLEKLKKQGVIPSLSESQAGGFAEVIHNELESWYTNTSAIIAVFNQVQNLADVYLIISKYGSRWQFGATYAGFYTMPEFMVHQLPSTEISLINDILVSKNINYKF